MPFMGQVIVRFPKDWQGMNGSAHCQEVSPTLPSANLCVNSQDPDEASPGEMATLTSFGSVV